MNNWKSKSLKNVEDKEAQDSEKIQLLLQEESPRTGRIEIKVPSQVKIELESKADEQTVVKADGSRPMSGPLTLSGAPTADLHASTKKYVDDAVGVGGITTFSDGDTTPSVSGARVCRTANTGGTTITNFDDGVDGQIVIIQFNDNYTTIADGANIKLQGGVNFTGAQYDQIYFTLLSTIWIEGGRSLNS